MQIGEPVSVAPPAPMPNDVEFAAELVAVTFKSGINASHAKVQIKGPHWELGKDAEITDDWTDTAKKLGLPPEPYSRRGAVYLIKSGGGSYDVEVKVKVTKSKNVSGDAKLTGNIRDLAIEGTCPTGAGEHTVVAKIIEPPEDIQWYRGRIGWGMEVPSAGMTVMLGSSLAELYFIMAEPIAAYLEGVWVEALRFLCGKVGVIGKQDSKEVGKTITAYCHSRHGLRYDVFLGASRYGPDYDGGSFELHRYMTDPSSACNCYDQAGAVQALSGALGILVNWRYAKPFGFIKPANLVGHGECNNPFFKRDVKRKMIAWDSPQRTWFANHAFASNSSGQILDACAGPHLGTETPEQYLAASIDTSASIYNNKTIRRPGTANDIVPMPGITKVE